MSTATVFHLPSPRALLNTLAGEKTLWAFAAILAVAAVAEWPSVLPLLSATASSYAQTLPFILLSVGIAAGVKASGADATVARALSGRGAVLTAALFGALSPFCSCGVIPLIAGMLAAGAPLAPVMAFWLASPVIDPEMLILTWNMLGAQLALAKLSAAIGIGLLGGVSVMALQSRGMLLQPLRAQMHVHESENSCCGSSSDTPSEQIVWRFWQDATRRAAFIDEAVRMVLFLSKWLLLAFLLEAVMLRWVPLEALVADLNTLGYAAIPLAALVGVPAYLNGYAAIPLMRGLLDAGLPPGAALSFMVAGGVTCIPAVVGVWGLVRSSTFAIYLGVAAIGSVLVGLLFQFISV